MARGLGFLDGVKNFRSRPPAEPAELHGLRHEVRAYPPPECRLGTAEDFAALISGKQRVSDNSFGDYGISGFASHHFFPLEFDGYRYASEIVVAFYTRNRALNLVSLARDQLDDLPALAGHVVGPSLHQCATLFDEIRPAISPRHFATGNVLQDRLRHFVRRVCSFRQPVAKGQTKAMWTSVAARPGA